MMALLNKPEYVHVLLNPLPVYGLAVAIFGLIIALLLRTRAARVTALALVMLSTRGHYMGETDLLASPTRAADSLTPGVWERLQAIRRQYDP
jgi:hypothetical protein